MRGYNSSEIPSQILLCRIYILYYFLSVFFSQDSKTEIEPTEKNLGNQSWK